MKEENKIYRMYNQWKQIHKEFEKLGDPVSVECMKQTNAMTQANVVAELTQ